MVGNDSAMCNATGGVINSTKLSCKSFRQNAETQG